MSHVKKAKIIVTLAIVTAIGLLIMLSIFETKMVYPAPSPQAGDWEPGFENMEDVTFPSEDGTQIHAWYLKHAQPKAHLVFFHGNGEHLGYLSTELYRMRQRYEVSVFAFDYRGYGHSAGKPKQAGILADGLAAQRWLAEREGIDPGQIVLFGRSLGGAVAVHNAAKLGARGLILDRTFDSLVSVAAQHMRWLPVRWIMRNRFDSLAHLPQYAGPLLQLHGEADRIVPISHGRKLFDVTPHPDKRFLSQPGMGHNAAWPPAWEAALLEFLAEGISPLGKAR